MSPKDREILRTGEATHLIVCHGIAPHQESSQMTDGTTQLEKCKQAARDLETDDDADHFKERLVRLVKLQPGETPE